MNENVKGMVVAMADFAALLVFCAGLFYLMWWYG